MPSIGESLADENRQEVEKQAETNEKRFQEILSETQEVYNRIKSETNSIWKANDEALKHLKEKTAQLGYTSETIAEKFAGMIPQEDLNRLREEEEGGVIIESKTAPPPAELPIEKPTHAKETKHAPEASEEEKDKIVAEAMSVFQEALDAGKSISEAEKESQKKFNELMATVAVGRAEDIVDIHDRLKAKWRELEEEIKIGTLHGQKETRDLEKRLKENKEPAEKADWYPDEKSPAERLTANKIIDETLRICQENISNRSVGTEEKKRKEETREESVGYLIDRLRANGIVSTTEVQSAIKELRTKMAEIENSEEDEIREKGLEPVYTNEKPDETIPPLPVEPPKNPEPIGKPLNQKEMDDLMGITVEPEPITPPAGETGSEVKELTTLDISPEGEKAVEGLADVEKIAADGVSEEEVKNKLAATLEKIPEKDREKIGLGFNNIGFFVKERVNGKIANWAGFLEAKFQNNNTARLAFSAIRESYYRDSADAKRKMEEIASGGDKKAISQTAYVAGGALRFGRIAADFLGYTATLPLRYWTLGAQIASRGVGFIKEARLKSDEVLSKTGRRVEDINEAAEEAWKLYTEAQAESGDKEITAKDLEKTALPERLTSIIERLKKDTEPGVANKIQELVFKKYIEASIGNIGKKLEKIASDTSLTPQERDLKTEQLFSKYSDKLKDFDRILSDQGTVDTLAMLAKYASGTAKAATAAMAVQTLYLSGEKLWEHLSAGLGEKTFDAVGFESGTTHQEIPSGLTPEEIQENIKIRDQLKIINPDGVKSMDFYGNAKVENSGQPLKEFWDHPEKINTLGVTENLKSTHFENPILGDRDNVWNSTEDTFKIYNRDLGYDPAKDGNINEWARRKTAEVIKELADKKYGGKMPDLVHEGDKVIVSITDGKPHLDFEASSGIKAGHLAEHAPSLKVNPEIPPAETGNTVGVDKFEKAWQETSVDSRDSIVRQYVAREIADPKYQSNHLPQLSPKKLEAFVQMFEDRGGWKVIKTPESLGQALQNFDVDIKSFTRQLVEGRFDKNLKSQELASLKASVFPIESKNGNIFFAQFQDKGQWKLYDVDAQGYTHSLDHKKGFLGGKTEVFDTLNVRKFLRKH